MKKILLIAAALNISAALFSFTPVSLVTFRARLNYTIGEGTQSITAERTLSPFSINRFETTYGLWYEIRTKAERLGYNFENPGQPGSTGRRNAIPTEENINQPVTMISWYDAIIWCNALSELQNRTPCYVYKDAVLRDSSDTASCDLCTCKWEADGFRLPSEAEWEFASRRTKTGFQPGNYISGASSEAPEEGYLYSWTSENTTETRIAGTAGIPFDDNNSAQAEAGTGNANHAGLYDMSGNVLEFCWDWFADYQPDLPYGPKVGYERISRGGSYSEYTMFNFCSDRYSFDPNECYNYFGFRIACTTENQ